jgi:hypothetical protein
MVPLLASMVSGVTLARVPAKGVLAGAEPVCAVDLVAAPGANQALGDLSLGANLAHAAEGVLAPPEDEVYPARATGQSYFQSLPPVPRPILMVLIGFACISLVHDRQVWLAMIAAVFSVGHLAIDAEPAPTFHDRGRRPTAQSSVLASEPLVACCAAASRMLCVVEPEGSRVRAWYGCISTGLLALVERPPDDKRLESVGLVGDNKFECFSATLPNALLARGPPDRTHVTVCLPCAEEGSVRARPFD